MEFCTHYGLSAFTHVDKTTALFTRLRCKQWTCEYCAKKNQAIWAMFLKEKLPDVAPDWWLVTLTAHAHMRTAALSLKNIRENIDRFLKRIRRVFGKVEYVRVYEKHPTSEARHAHIIISGLQPFVVPGASSKHVPMVLAVLVRQGVRGSWSIKTWFKKVAQECNMGYMVDIQPIENEPGKAVNYVVKYLTKSQQDLSEKGLRHVQTSRGIGSPKSTGEHVWKVVSFVSAKDFQPGQDVIDLQTGEAISPNYWEDFDLYPPENN